MAGGGTLNLSLLSRGVGEVQRNGQEKVEVFLEPEDYYNFRDAPDRYYFPPIRPKYTLVEDPAQLSSRDSKECQEIHLPKTFTTRKGALLLFSEDLALRDSERDQTEQQDGSDPSAAIKLKTVEDLAKSILSYGNNESNSVYMKFLHRKREKFQRQIRPGFSAKRYLATWTRSWDDNILETVINKGYITDRSMFQYNMVVPHLRRRVFFEDLSHYPPPYRLMRNMLLSPGSLSGYTFYRAVPEYEDMMDGYDRDVDHESLRSRPPTSIKVIRTRDGRQREISYASLDRKSQEEVITDLLVKSAVHYALRKQQEYMHDELDEIEAANREPSVAESERKVSSSMKTPVKQFDMKEAVESLLDSHRQLNLDADLPALENQSNSSGGYGGSFKGMGIPAHSVKGHSAKTRSWPYGIDEAGKEYIGIAPIVSMRDGSSSPSGSVTSLPQLPAVRKHPLTPIKDVSRETTQNILLPPIQGADGIPHVSVEPPTPQHSTLMKQDEKDANARDDQDWEFKGAEKRRHGKRQKGESHHSSMESIPHSQVQSIPSKNRPHWQGSQQSLKSVGSRKGPGSAIGEGSLKGSIICAPDGEIISVGGSVGPKHGDVAPLQDVTLVNKRIQNGEVEESVAGSDVDEPEEWKESRRKVHAEGGGDVVEKKTSRKESSTSEQMLVDALTEHAQKIAQSVLLHSESGMNLEADIRRAATLWTERHPGRDISRSQSVQEKANTDAIEEIMKNQRINSADPTAADYRQEIQRNLTTAVAKATGLRPDSIPADAEITPELLEALANQSLTPEDIEIIKDPESGRSTLRTKSQLSRVMGGVKEGHLYVSPGGSEEPTVSIPSERVTVKDVGDVDVISYGVPETGDLTEDHKSKTSSKTPSVKDGEGRSRKPSAASQGPAEDDFAKAVKRLEEEGKGKTDTPDDEASEKGSSVTGVSKASQKSEDSKKSKGAKKKTVSLEDREEFVVGKPKQKAKVEKPAAPKKEDKKKKEKKVKAKKEKKEEPAQPVREATPPPPPKSLSPKQESPEPAESYSASPDRRSEDMEFVFVRDRSVTPDVKDSPSPHEPSPPSMPPTEPTVEEVDEPEDEDDTGPKQISNKDARLAKRAAAAAKKREEVERRRREKEEDMRRQKEESERQEHLKREMEEERKRRDEERRLRKLREEEDRQKEAQADQDREKRKQMEMERERRAKEEYQRKLEEMRRKQAEEEEHRIEVLREKQREEEELRQQEEEMMSKMAEQERREYERRKREEEDLRKQREEAEKRRRDEEAARALEEAKRLAEEMARRQAELKARLQFNRDLQLEAHGLTHTQDITRMFVFSYFELLQWLGLDIPEFELQKLTQFT